MSAPTPSSRPPLMPATVISAGGGAFDPGNPPVVEPPARPDNPGAVPAGLASVTECLVCENPIRTMAFRFTGVCSGNCQKTLADRNRKAERQRVVLP